MSAKIQNFTDTVDETEETGTVTLLVRVQHSTARSKGIRQYSLMLDLAISPTAICSENTSPTI